ncbi:hypothetical protein MRB53_021618 [Persea americana]|uniref:Uncharacterized protein n=1 Tax=Persea americana TaxID=3435 RepID=A0ACC2L542_PERAE|nr:hypothetical protein MRB53_021618 [Persea americana]
MPLSQLLRGAHVSSESVATKVEEVNELGSVKDEKDQELDDSDEVFWWLGFAGSWEYMEHCGEKGCEPHGAVEFSGLEFEFAGQNDVLEEVFNCGRPAVAVEGPDLFARAWMVWQGSKAPASESGGFFKSETCFQGAEISLDKMTCVQLLEMFPVVFERLNSKALKLSGTSDTSMPHFYDFKWLNDLMDWGKSSLVVLRRHWKQCFLSLLNILQVSCHVNSARIIMDIETLISCDFVSIDDVKDQTLTHIPNASLLDLFQRKYAHSVIVRVGQLIFQQFGGINGIGFYASETFVSAGFGRIGRSNESLPSLFWRKNYCSILEP